MVGGLVAGYGAFGAVAVRFLYPAKDTPTEWLYVARAADLRPGDSFTWRSPAGESVAVACAGDGGFLALSSTCPHLGCQVHWEPQNSRFFCPCHNGAFDAAGKATAGPPADAGQSLLRFPLKVEGGLLYIQVPAAPLSRCTGCPWAGHA
jgi:Rieske Fe-S protein